MIECVPKCHSNGLCVNGRCICLPEYDGDGIHSCFKCSTCDTNAFCYPNQEKCVCKPGFSGDGEKCSITGRSILTFYILYDMILYIKIDLYIC